MVGHAGELISIADKEEDPEVAKELKGYSDQIAEVKNAPSGATTVHALPNPRLSDSDVKCKK